MVEAAFETLYERWFVGNCLDRALEQELRDRYREAWISGSTDDRDSVLDFIYETRFAPAFDLIVQGLDSSEPPIPEHSLAIAVTLIREGLISDRAMEAGLIRFESRFPEFADISSAALVQLRTR